jgi:uncharacterized protein (DUF983 family)
MMAAEQLIKQIDTEGMVLDVEHVSLAPAKATREVLPGELCPRCGEGHLDYNGLLNLACPKCSYALGGCFT